MIMHPTSKIIDNRFPALSAPPYYVRRRANQKWQRVAHYFLTYLDVARQRRHLRALDERSLKDVGISRTDAFNEANRYFWDIPEGLKPRR